MKKYFIFILLLIVSQAIYANTSSSFRVISNNSGVSIFYGGNEKVVNTALDILINDSRLVAKVPISRVTEIQQNTIIVGIPEDDSELRELAEHYQIEYKDLSGKWEAYKMQAVQNGENSYLFIMGSDPRGTAYGILEISKQMGVTPWVWWADVTPDKNAEVLVTADRKVYAPSVQYRGIFLNDEDWALMPWSTRTYEPTPRRGAIGPKTYAKIFELLLRLRANTIWPAMHECTIPFFFVEGNKEAAEKYGIIVSNSHAEPMMRTNTGEWNDKRRGPFNFLTNKQQVLSYWEERAKELVGSENIYTIGMRGIHDGRMQGVKTIDDETNMLGNVIAAQRDILQRANPDKDIYEIPQQFVPYKEVLKAYENGLELPEDITLVWCDDNHGYIMRLSDPEEQKRSGGSGVYYHISYWGKPHDYLWLASTQPGLIYTEMKRAWDNNARRLWILNVGDIKPGEYLTEFFLDMAWDMESFTGNTIYAYQKKWIEKIFGSKSSDNIHSILKQYYHLAGQRKPEHMGWNEVEDWTLGSPGGLQPVKDTEFSPTTFGDEMEQRIRAYNEIATLSCEIYKNEIANPLKTAYFQLIHYPVVASGAMNRKILYAQKSRMYATQQHVELADYYAKLAIGAYNEIAALNYLYNKDVRNGKWELMMDMKPRDLPVFQEPVLPDLMVSCRNNKFSIPKVPALAQTAGTQVEGDRMIAFNACDYVNDIRLETIESLGHGSKAVRLPVAEEIKTEQPHLEYKITTVSKGDAKIKVGVIPQHSVHGETKRRYAIVIDTQKPVIVETHARFLSDKWTENVLRNQSLTVSNIHLDESGEHIIRIYAIDEELLVDQLMLDFDLERKHYLIPAGK